MKTKPFNLDEAKAGKPFRHKTVPEEFVKYHGIREDNGSIIFEFKSRHYAGNDVTWAPPAMLEMVVEPEKVTVYLYRVSSGFLYASIVSPDQTGYGYKFVGKAEIEVNDD